MMMERGLDTGPSVAMSRTRIEPHDTTESVTARLAVIGAGLAADAIPALVSGRIEPIPQPDGASSVRQLTKADGQIDWSRPAEYIERQVRAMWPWPRAWTTLGDRTLQIHSASLANTHHPAGAVTAPRHSGISDGPAEEPPPGSENLRPSPGSVRIVDDHPAVICGDGGVLVIEQGQIPGSKPNSGANLLRGRFLSEGDQFTSRADSPPPLILPVV
jgi:methionyl-tRNA formyltransferase